MKDYLRSVWYHLIPRTPNDWYEAIGVITISILVDPWIDSLLWAILWVCAVNRLRPK